MEAVSPRVAAKRADHASVLKLADVAVLVTPEPKVRRLAVPTLSSHGWSPMAFRDPATAFHYACGNAFRLGAALVDEDVGSFAAKTLLRRLETLARGRVLRSAVIPGSDRVGRIRLRSSDYDDAQLHRMGELVWALVRARLGRPVVPTR